MISLLIAGANVMWKNGDLAVKLGPDKTSCVLVLAHKGQQIRMLAKKVVGLSPADTGS